MSEPAAIPVMVRNLRAGWWALLGYLLFGIALEVLHGFKIGFYLDVPNHTRRLMWTLAHAHGTLLALVNIAFALTVPHLQGFTDKQKSVCSLLLRGALILLPGGFFLGGMVIYSGDPGIGIVLVPVGALFLLAGVLLVALRTPTGRSLSQIQVAIGAAILFASAFCGNAAEPIFTERVFGPEVPTGKYKHPACITELSSGDLYLAYYGGAGEYARATAVFGARLPHGSKTWSAPEPIASNPFQSMGNPVLWEAPDKSVWLFFVVRPGATWSSSRVMAKISHDSARSWSEPFVVAWEAGMMVRSRPILLSSGEYLLPIYHETGDDPEFTAADTTSLFLRFDPKKQKWSESNRVRSRMGNLQPAVVEIAPNHLLAFCRRGGDYKPRTDGFVVRTESRDGGKTWSDGIETSFPNPNAAVELIRLRNGHLLFVFNDSFNDRTPLTAAISTDHGQTFLHRRNLAEGKGDFGYPTAIQTTDGKIHVTYTSDERTVVRHAIFTEEEILKAD